MKLEVAVERKSDISKRIAKIGAWIAYVHGRKGGDLIDAGREVVLHVNVPRTVGHHERRRAHPVCFSEAPKDGRGDFNPIPREVKDGVGSRFSRKFDHTKDGARPDREESQIEGVGFGVVNEFPLRRVPAS